MHLEEDDDGINQRKLGMILSGILILFGLISSGIYMTMTIFYPLFDYNAFVGRALNMGMEDVLVERYKTFLPFMAFGVMLFFGGYWIWRTKRDVSKGTLTLISVLTLVTFLLILFNSPL